MFSLLYLLAKENQTLGSYQKSPKVPMKMLQHFPIVALTCVISVFFFFLLRISIRIRSRNSPPMAGGAWPILGHLRLLGGPKLPHVVLGDLADRYGPVFSIRVGVHPTLVVSSWEVAKECFTKNDKSFSNRPPAIGLEHMGYNYAMFEFAPNGPYWREMRRIAILELLSNHRLASLGHVRELVIRSSIKSAYKMGNKSVVEMKRWFGDLTIDVIFRIVAGKSFTELGNTEEGERCRTALRRFFELVGVYTMGDAVPFLRYLDIGGYEKEMKKVGMELDSVLSGWLEEHKQKAKNGEIKDNRDFMDVMLSILDESTFDEKSFNADTINKATCLVMALGATDTTTVTLTWALALLLNNPSTMKKAQDELDTYIGRERQVKESDINNFTYLKAIVKETLRLYPAAQIIPARQSVEDCHVSSYKIPSGTRLLVNLWKIHRDPRVWPDPSEFKPERFLEREIDVRGHNFELLPFGSGRRVCPGISFALQIVEFTLARFLHSFEVKNASGKSVDMTEGFGMSTAKKTPLEVVLSPRLPARLYIHEED